MIRQKFLNHRRQVDGALTNKALLEHAHLHWGAKWDIKVGCNDLPRFLRYFVFILSMQWNILPKIRIELFFGFDIFAHLACATNEMSLQVVETVFATTK